MSIGLGRPIEADLRSTGWRGALRNDPGGGFTSAGDGEVEADRISLIWNRNAPALHLWW